MPITIIGAQVNGKPNFNTIAHVGIMDFSTISISLAKVHYTNKGIKENKTFSVNIPKEGLVKETDFAGMVSGETTDKSKVFEAFYGSLKTAPMILECPINMECKLIQTIEFPKHEVFLGEIVETFCGDEFLVDGKMDISKVQPILFVMDGTSYWNLGSKISNAWKVGKELVK
ncbi:flavin reductase family protein [bacterium]|nr:flavin reductase family protein [bacterium]